MSPAIRMQLSRQQPSAKSSLITKRNATSFERACSEKVSLAGPSFSTSSTCAPICCTASATRSTRYSGSSLSLSHPSRYAKCRGRGEKGSCLCVPRARIALDRNHPRLGGGVSLPRLLNRLHLYSRARPPESMVLHNYACESTLIRGALPEDPAGLISAISVSASYTVGLCSSIRSMALTWRCCWWCSALRQNCDGVNETIRPISYV